MKELIKKILHEAVGVPKGIEISARNIYYDMIQKLKKEPQYLTNGEKFMLDDASKYSFSDFGIEYVEIVINLMEATNIDDYRVAGMGIVKRSERKGGRFEIQMSRYVDLQVSIATPVGEPDPDKVLELLESDSAKYISSLAHELKHGYDDFKDPKGPKVEDVAIYQIFSNARFGNEVVDTFLYDSYFTTFIESLVRPSELYSLATEKSITKKDFLNFLKESDTFQTLQRIAGTSYEDFREKLKQNMKFVNEVIKNFRDEKTPKDDEGKIDLFLKGLYVTLGNHKINKFRDMITPNNPLNAIKALFAMFGGGTDIELDEEDEKLFNKFQNKIRAYENREVEYFKNAIREQQYQARQAIKKLGKVYSILPDGPETEKIKENYQKIEIFDPINFEMDQLVKKIRKITLFK